MNVGDVEGEAGEENKSNVRCSTAVIDLLLPRGVIKVPSISTLLRDQERLPTVEVMKDLLICEALRRTQGNVGEAAKMVRMGRATLYRWCIAHSEYQGLYDPSSD